MWYFSDTKFSDIYYIFNRKQEEAILKRLESCNNRRGQAMMDNKTCDCTLSDYAYTKINFAPQGRYLNKYVRCIPRGEQSLTQLISLCDYFIISIVYDYFIMGYVIISIILMCYSYGFSCYKL